MRDTYQALMDDPARLEAMLMAGAAKARAIATPFTARLRHAVGLRRLGELAAPAKTAKASKVAIPSFKQYREADGRFAFKFVDAQGQLLLQSLPFDSPKAAAQAIARLQTEGLAPLADVLQAPVVDTAAIDAALTQLRLSKQD
jgi:tryptophanyl-tRNA synthetase